MKLDLGPVDAIPTDRAIAVGEDERFVAVRVGGEIRVFTNRCLHQDSPLAGARCDDRTLQCPLHFWRYHLPSGVHTGGRGALPSHPVTIEDDHAWAEVPAAPQSMSIRDRLLARAHTYDRATAAEEAAARARRNREALAAPGRTADSGPIGGVETVVWDMGGIFRAYPTEAMARHGREQGWPLDRVPMGPTGDLPDDRYEAMSDGELGEREYLDLVLADLAAEGIGFDPLAQPARFFPDRAQVWVLLRELGASRDHRQAILTNDAARWLGESWWETWPRRDLFDVIVDSTMVGERKPAEEPFVEVLRRLGRPDPSTCVFVDDMRMNTAAAAQLGMRSVTFDITDPGRSVAAVRRVVGL